MTTFAQALRNEGVEFYLEQLVAESLTSPEIVSNSSKNIRRSEYSRRETKKVIRELLHGIKDNQELIMAGVQKVELPEILEEAKA